MTLLVYVISAQEENLAHVTKCSTWTTLLLL